MAKKVEEEVQEPTSITLLDVTEFNREDLNKLASKLNEIISFLNK